jgi:iron complex outermembrane receptor protein
MSMVTALCGAIFLLAGSASWAQAPPSAAPSDDVLQEVIVTAQKRTENLQTTPITANVLSGKDLQDKDITNLESLQFFNPGMS